MMLTVCVPLVYFCIPHSNIYTHCTMSLYYWNLYKEPIRKTIVYQNRHILMFKLGLSASMLSDLRQCVIEVFCSTSTDKSKKSSSLLLICERTKSKDTPQIIAQPITAGRTIRIPSYWTKVFTWCAITVSQVRHRVSLVNVPWKISWTQVEDGGVLLLFCESSVPLASLPFCLSCLRSSCSRSAIVFSR